MHRAELAVLAAAVIALLAPIPQDFVERWFSAGLYPLIQRALTPATNLLPVAILDILVLAALVRLTVGLVRTVRRAWQQRSLRPVLSGAFDLVAAAAAVYLVFLLLWGFNYRRVPMTVRLDVTNGAPAADMVMALGRRAVREMNQLHAPAHRAGWNAMEWRDPDLRGAFMTVQGILSDASPAAPGRLKQSLLGFYFRWTSVDGMVNPFGLEVLANPDLLPFERPFVAAHEWAHLAGYADESEASFVGWLTTLHANDAARYSGWLFLYWQVSGDVSGDERRELASMLEDGPRRDVDAIVDRLRRGGWPLLRTAGWAVYDQYLKANRVDAGIRSYSEVVTLILRARFDDSWTPARRDSRRSPAP